MRILVIEDEPDMLSVIAKTLRLHGFAVDEAPDGEEGLFKALSAPYDVIVLDVMMPKIDGWQVLRKLRQTHKVPVLILSARDTVADRVRGLDQGADDYLIKPFALTELIARIQALIRRSAGESRSQIVLGEFVVDLRAREVLCKGKRVDLTPREFALVELFSLHRGELVSKTCIHEHIFDENDDSMSNLLEVHISNIRKKLGSDFIKTRRGQGYIVDD